MKIGGYFNVWFKDGSKNTTGIVRVDQTNNNTIADGQVLTKKGIVANWRKISDGKKGLGFCASEATVAAYKQAAIEKLTKDIKAVEEF